LQLWEATAELNTTAIRQECEAHQANMHNSMATCLAKHISGLQHTATSWKQSSNIQESKNDGPHAPVKAFLMAKLSIIKRVKLLLQQVRNWACCLHGHI
jgi:hypothetical protein